MSISAGLVKELRDRTGAAMMDCKKALIETDGEMEKAIDFLRKQGLAKAAKKAGRIAAEGVITFAQSTDGKSAFMAEINCETDFVARDATFKEFVEKVAALGLAQKMTDRDALLNAAYSGAMTVEQARQELVQKIGENVNIRRIEYRSTPGSLGAYVHGGRIGVLVALDKEAKDLARDVAMHIAATNPSAIDQNNIDPKIIEREREVFTAQAKESGKSDEIIEKMIQGRIAKFMKEVCVVDQPFVKDPEQTVGALLKKNQTSILSYVRFEVGEGIEKEVVDFAEEVRAQVQGS